jgi:Flp pilus assembly protein TadG
VELVLTLPLLVLMMFFIIEIGRAWMTYDSAKMAARDGAYTASIYHNATVGETQMTNKLNAAGLDVKTLNVQQINNRHAYKANVTVTFTPFFGGLSIPTISGPMTILPKSFDLSYSSITDVAIY